MLVYLWGIIDADRDGDIDERDLALLNGVGELNFAGVFCRASGETTVQNAAAAWPLSGPNQFDQNHDGRVSIADIQHVAAMVMRP